MRQVNLFIILFVFPMITFGQTSNTRYGTGALNTNLGSYNSAFGAYALYTNTSGGNYNTATGISALRFNSTGTNNTANGAYSLYSNTTGSYNSAIGTDALSANLSGKHNIAIGSFTLVSNTYGNYNTAIGNYALFLNNSGCNNTATGYYSLFNNNSGGNNNTANGYYALYNNAGGFNNSAIGSYALYSNTSGYYNTANGSYALYSNTTGIQNTATGYNALRSNITAHHNTATGYIALRDNKGNYNTATGSETLCVNTTGVYNTAFGYSALPYNTTGNYNTAIGALAGWLNGGNRTNSTAIGYEARNDQNDQIMLGNTSVVHIGGYVGWTTYPSDGRAKKNIRADVPGLAFINLLQPVTYNIDLDFIDEIMKSDDPEINRHIDSLRLARSTEENEILAKSRYNKERQVHSGFIAQDVEKAAQSIGYDFCGIDSPENDKSVYGLRYGDFVVPLVKAVQELSEQNNRLQEAVQELREQNNRLQEQIYELANAPKSQNVGESGVAKNFSFSLFPNPTNGFVTIDYTLNVDALIFIELCNIYGQRVKLIVPQQSQISGQYSVQTSVADLGTGTYVVKFFSDNQVESKQLIVNN